MIDEKRVKRYCCDDVSKIENYSLAMNDECKTWHCHHRLEIQDNGTKISPRELMDRGLYYHRPASELIFLTKSEHFRLHQLGNKYFIGNKHSEETKLKMSLAHKGYTHSEEAKRKISESHIGKKHSEETRRKLSIAHKGRRNSEEARRKMSDALKGKKKPPFSEEHRRKMSEAIKAWWARKKNSSNCIY